MNIVYAMTRNIYRKILPSLRSLSEFHPKANVYILAEDDELPFDTPIKCNIVNVSNQRMFDKSENIKNLVGGYINLLKVYYPTLLPDIDKVIHLDVDTIICDTLDDFWNIDINGKWFASVPEYLAKHGREKLFGELYYNMGVSLINLKQMRQDKIEDVMAKYLIEVEQPFADQDAWNKYGIENDKGAIVPLRFNENQSTGYTNNPAIVHFCGISNWYENKWIYRREYLDKYLLENNQKYMIHSCNDRQWYVDEYLVPSMAEQGIQKDDIIIWQDKKCVGNLASFVASCRWISDNLEPYESTWHLQDDVVLSPKFKETAERKYDGFANAFCNEKFDGERTNYIGVTTPSGMWFSFQCILIPNIIAGRFAKWFDDGEAERLYPKFVASGKCDDSLFRFYTMSNEPNVPAVNIYPCIVDHIDYLIGGTIINKQRDGKFRKAYWRDSDGLLDRAVADLEREVSRRVGRRESI